MELVAHSEEGAGPKARARQLLTRHEPREAGRGSAEGAGDQKRAKAPGAGLRTS